jgi:hypothetical protein
MPNFSRKMGGKEIGHASDYAKPHTMSGKATTGQPAKKTMANEKAAKDVGLSDPVPNGVSYGKSGEPKTSGIKMRGAGAATKGTMSRGPMA